jgi:hypothetical protein
LARRERRSVADIVERALEAYESAQTGRESAASFYARMSNDFATDVDLDLLLRESRKVNSGLDL